MYPCGTTFGFDTALIEVPGGIASYGDQAISFPSLVVCTIEPSHLSTQTFSPCGPVTASHSRSDVELMKACCGNVRPWSVDRKTPVFAFCATMTLFGSRGSMAIPA